MSELFCRCGHGEFAHVEPLPKDGSKWLIRSFPCTFQDARGCCACLDFHLAPRRAPATPACPHRNIEAVGEGFRRCKDCGEMEPRYQKRSEPPDWVTSGRHG